MNKLKNHVKKIISSLIWHLNKLSLFRYILDSLLKAGMNTSVTIVHKGHKLNFVAPNPLIQYRIETFASKEPETLSWIDSFEKNSIFWDIGANIGLYSCYAAINKNCSVMAFEPSIFNLEVLARNVFLNALNEKICIFPIPLNNETSISTLNMTSTSWGGALSTFNQNYGQDGNLLKSIFSYTTVGLSMDSAITNFKLPPPRYIKIDVDGIEHLILEGGATILGQVNSVLVEINDNFKLQSENAIRYLKQAGLQLHNKANNQTSANSSGIFNQIWTRGI